MICIDFCINLHPVAGGDKHGSLHCRQFAQVAVSLRKVVIGESEPSQQFDGRCAVRNPQRKNGHCRARSSDLRQIGDSFAPFDGGQRGFALLVERENLKFDGKVNFSQ